MAFVVLALSHALVVVVLTAVAWATGSLAARYLQRSNDDAVPWPMVIAIGLATLGHTALVLGLAGWLRAPVAAALALAIVVAAASEWRRLAGAARAVACATRATFTTWAVVAILAGPTALLTLYPPIGFDQTMYHLPQARAFAATGALPVLPELRFPVFPALAEVLEASVLLFVGDVASQTVGWLALMACAGLASVWAREQSTTAGGWLAAAMLVGSPIAIYLGATGYVEPVLGLFTLASFYAADRARRSLEEGRGAVAWLVLAGGLAGSAASVKYLGLLALAAAAGLLLPRLSWRIGSRALGWYALAAMVTLAPTYARLIVLTANPLFPFFSHVFGSSHWDAHEYVQPQGVARLLAVPTFLWDISFRRHLVGGLPFWSPAFVLGAPIGLAAAWFVPARRRLAIVAVGYLLVSPINAHYFLGIAPLWCVLVGTGASQVAGASRAGRRLLHVVAVVVALGGAAYTGYRVHVLGLPPATLVERERLLDSHLPLHPAIAFINRTAGAVVVYGVDAERMVYYAAGTLLGDHNGPASYTRVSARAQALGSLASALDEVGAAYLLIPAGRSFWTEQAAADRRLSVIYSDRGATVYRLQARHDAKPVR